MDKVSTAAADRAVASRAHLVTLCAILLGVALLGYLAFAGAAPAGPGRSGPAPYLPLLAAEWGLFLYVRMGLGRRGTALGDLISIRPLTPRAFALDLCLGLLLLVLWLAVDYGFDLAFGSAIPAGVQPLLVRRAADIPLWILLAASAGFVEELVFRGYLQRQFAGLLGRPWAGVAAQAIMFGVTHGYQGGLPILRIALFGLIFGAAAQVRRSLVPGMAAHAAVDIVGGLAAFR